MKIEISLDQNTLTINKAVYEAKPAIPKGYCIKCSFARYTDKQCLNPLVNQRCSPKERSDNKDIVWVKKYEN